MFVVVSRLKIPPVNLEKVVGIIHSELVPAMQRTPGFIEFTSVPSAQTTDLVSVLNISIWESEHAFRQFHRNKPTSTTGW